MKRLLFLTLLLTLFPTIARSADFSWTGGRWWGISVSYSLKWYSYAAGGGRHWVNFWGEGGNMQGVQFGVPVQPVLWRGFGAATGVFCEIYSAKNDAETKRVEDVNLYFPFHAMWSCNLNSTMRLHLQTGPGLTVGICQRVIDPTNSLAHQYWMRFNDGTPRRVNCYWEAGVSLMVNMFRFQALYGIGLTPSRRYLSTMGAQTIYYSTNPTRLTFSAAVMF